MKQLLEDYRRRLTTIDEELDCLIDEAKNMETITRLVIKRGCYRTFIVELERIIPRTPDPIIDKFAEAERIRKEYEEWQIENNQKNEKFMREQDEIEARAKANELPEM